MTLMMVLTHSSKNSNTCYTTRDDWKYENKICFVFLLFLLKMIIILPISVVESFQFFVNPGVTLVGTTISSRRYQSILSLQPLSLKSTSASASASASVSALVSASRAPYAKTLSASTRISTSIPTRISLATRHSCLWWSPLTLNTSNKINNRRSIKINVKNNDKNNDNDNDNDIIISRITSSRTTGSRRILKNILYTITISFPAILRKWKRKWKRKRKLGNSSNNNNNSNIIINHLPLRSAFIAIGLYLSIGVIGYKYILLSSLPIIDILYFCFVCLSTVGYGDVIVPITNSQKVFTILYAMSGILLWSSAIGTIVSKIIELETNTATSLLKNEKKSRLFQFYDKHMPNGVQQQQQQQQQQQKEKEKQLQDQQDNQTTAAETETETETTKDVIIRTNSSIVSDSRGHEMEATKTTTAATASNNKQLLSSPSSPSSQLQILLQLWKTILFKSLPKPIFVILSCGYIIGKVEGWNILDSIYFSFITATTIGLGDIVPVTKFGRIFAIILIPALLAAAGQIFASITQICIRQQQQKLFQMEYNNGLTQKDFSLMDLNQDGKISKDEYVLYMLMEMSIVEIAEVNELRDQFKKFDVTQSGFIESEDLRIMGELRRRRNTTTTTTPTHI
jgi:Ca2+-binding EF-hand superfamily protein